MDIDKFNTIHFVGLKGIAMTALALFCQEKGFAISGSDTAEVFPSDEILENMPHKRFTGFKKEHIRIIKPDLVIYTGAHDARMNSEVEEAIRLKIPIMPHGKALGFFMQGNEQISIAGCHGKTTTTSMISSIFTAANIDPSYVIGSGKVGGLGLPGHYGLGKYFIAEADEYVTEPNFDNTPRFMWQHPDTLIITNVDYDHPDVYSGIDAVFESYSKLVNKVPASGYIILNNEDAYSQKFKDIKATVLRVGFENTADFVIKDFSLSKNRSKMKLTHQNEKAELELQIPGRHNLLNAAMASACARVHNIPWDIISESLRNFTGAKRRFENIGTHGGLTFIDDYAHHPKEIEATLSAARQRFQARRIIAVFQPHTFTRTKALLSQFSLAFSQADAVILTAIYGSAREKNSDNLYSQVLFGETRKNHEHVFFANNPTEVEKLLVQITKQGDVILFMGAGDIYTWEKKVVQSFNH